jgi:hypothetical protein
MHFLEFQTTDQPEPRIDASLLGQIEVRFRSLSAADLVLDLQPIGNHRPVIAQVRLVRLILGDRRTNYEDRDLIWRHLVHFANHHSPDWQLAAVGMAMPGLRHATRTRLGNPGPDQRDDIHADLVTGFLHHLTKIDIRRRNICGRLIAAGIRAARTGQQTQRTQSVGYDDTAAIGVLTGQVTAANQDDVSGLIAAWQDFTHVHLRPDDRLLIQMTRLQGADLATAARALGISVSAATSRRNRAEQRLAHQYRAGGRRARLDGRPSPGTVRFDDSR